LIKTIGLTGGLGSGKSTVLKMFKRLGAMTLDADRMAHRCLAPGTAAYRKIIRRFGRNVLGGQGKIDRRRLGEIIFKDTRSRAALERWVHPEVKAEIQKRLDCLPASRIAVIEVPLLFESGFQDLFDRVAVVWCGERERRERLIRRNHWKPPELETRLNAQWPLLRKRRLADIVIDNSKRKDATWKQVETIWKDFVGSS
jgi:dephospho-CoA kinase